MPAVFDMAIAYIAPFGPICGSMTGVEVMPICGVTWLQPRSSDGVSPLPSRETRQSWTPVSASNA